MLRQFAYILVAIVASTSVAFGQECVSPAALAMNAINSVPNASIKELLKDEAAQVVVAAYNAIEPKSEDVAEFVAVIQAPGVPVYLIIGYSGSCVVFTHTWEREAFDALRRSGV